MTGAGSGADVIDSSFPMIAYLVAILQGTGIDLVANDGANSAECQYMSFLQDRYHRRQR